jgi:hypothetical protein
MGRNGETMPIPIMDINMLPVSTIKAFLFIRNVSNPSESHARFISSQILPQFLGT